MPTPTDLAAVEAAHRAIAAAMATLADDELRSPSLLPGWSRAHVLAHIARNADGLANLVAWAESGVETPMYASVESREADIEATSTLAPDDLRAEVVQADDSLLAGLRDLSPEAGAVEVRALFGDPFPASDLPWVRAREAWVHLVDLDAGIGFEDVPTDVLEGLLAEAVERAPGRDLAEGFLLAETGSDRRWQLGPGPVTELDGTLPELVGWLTGRVPPGDRPEPPRWP
jgi:maleylpyruvate isomerase